jgi:hypothetical protein
MAGLRPMCNARSEYFLRKRARNLTSSPSVQDKKRKLSDSIELDILPKKPITQAFRKRASAFSNHTKSPLAQVSDRTLLIYEMKPMPQPDPTPKSTVKHHREITRSVSHLQYQKWQESIQQNRAEHARQMASEPANPIIPSMGGPRHQYEEYQIKVPVEALVARLEYAEGEQPWKDKWWVYAATSRLKQAHGLREWKWTFGEPEEGNDPELEQSASGMAEDTAVNSNEGKGQQTLSYASRMKTFTYTRGDDPMWKGKRYYYLRGKGLRVERGDFPNEMSQEDEDYIPYIENNIDMEKVPNPFRYSYMKQPEQEHQTCQTAADYLFGGPNRAEQKALEAEEEEICAGTDAAPQTASTDVVETGPADTQGEGEGAQELGHQRSDSDSGCSVMSDDSDENEEDEE